MVHEMRITEPSSLHEGKSHKMLGRGGKARKLQEKVSQTDLASLYYTLPPAPSSPTLLGQKRYVPLISAADY